MRTSRRSRAILILGLFGLSVVFGLLGLAQAPPRPRGGAFVEVPMPSVPLVATFWSAQLTNFPPWPFNPFSELPVYEVAAETFVFDDRAVDYEAMAKEALALRLLRQAAPESLGMETLSLEG